MNTPELKWLLASLYTILEEQNRDKSAPSILVQFGCGSRATKRSHGEPAGCGGTLLLELPYFKRQRRLHDVIISLPDQYQNLLTRKYTTNITNNDLAQEYRISTSAIKNKINHIYKEIKLKY